ncbi:disulfide bond formation protein B [Thermomonas hydrothermalis]|uniref:Disulfide bond formation protein B n=1 Tax=Thermomonas hydrothermalis TaxID=213588 RepID=A0A1M4V080_9GAMM|nr:disulfide bond formation protein B [Thermomonas hydrothermalis]MCL6619425.1 disulfide bond formation protein B [Thermomonas hydrothermalis]SHE62297.1 disulfide bond formation protein DsbB [Thermomonas hydrothermalis]
MNPLHWSFRTQFLFGFACCAGLLGYALYVQFRLGIEPCPFCIFQRLCFAALGLVFLAGALHDPRRPGARKAWALLACLPALAGVAYAGRHSWVQLHPPALPSCGPGINFIVEQYSWLGAARRVLQATGDCANIDWQFLGLTMPMWALLWFIGLGVGALYAGFRPRQNAMFRR